jgi:hypothetical protein
MSPVLVSCPKVILCRENPIIFNPEKRRKSNVLIIPQTSTQGSTMSETVELKPYLFTNKINLENLTFGPNNGEYYILHKDHYP